MAIKSRLKIVLAEKNAERLRQGKSVLTQSALARETGISKYVVWCLVADTKKRVEYDTVDRICAALDVQPGEIFVRE
jgi:DNA-binding Xre family transcriptional regulator